MYLGVLEKFVKTVLNLENPIDSVLLSGDLNTSLAMFICVKDIVLKSKL